MRSIENTVHADRLAAAEAALGQFVVVELEPLVNVTTNATTCACRSEDCYFCAARADAVWAAVADEEMEEWREKHDPTHWAYGL